jgi:hypothetical protein
MQLEVESILAMLSLRMKIAGGYDVYFQVENEPYRFVVRQEG